MNLHKFIPHWSFKLWFPPTLLSALTKCWCSKCQLTPNLMGKNIPYQPFSKLVFQCLSYQILSYLDPFCPVVCSPTDWNFSPKPIYISVVPSLLYFMQCFCFDLGCRCFKLFGWKDGTSPVWNENRISSLCPQASYGKWNLLVCSYSTCRPLRILESTQ